MLFFSPVLIRSCILEPWESNLWHDYLKALGLIGSERRNKTIDVIRSTVSVRIGQVLLWQQTAPTRVYFLLLPCVHWKRTGSWTHWSHSGTQAGRAASTRRAAKRETEVSAGSHQQWNAQPTRNTDFLLSLIARTNDTAPPLQKNPDTPCPVPGWGRGIRETVLMSTDGVCWYTFNHERGGSKAGTHPRGRQTKGKSLQETYVEPAS